MTCKCVWCGECDGSVVVWIGYSGKYKGKYSSCDMDEPMTCPECDGEGITEMCAECEEKEYEEYETR